VPTICRNLPDTVLKIGERFPCRASTVRKMAILKGYKPGYCAQVQRHPFVLHDRRPPKNLGGILSAVPKDYFEYL
jgi:hypothetical protein